MSEPDLSRLFDDGKEPGALRTIGEVAKALGIRQHVLRYWEEQFPVLKPVKRSGGRRYYRPEDVRLVATIDRLVHHEGYTLRGARQAIAGGAAKTGAAVQQRNAAETPEAMPVPSTRAGHISPDAHARLRAIRDTLAKALSRD